MSLEEVEQDPFDKDEYVERLAWRTTGGKSSSKNADFDPMVLHAAFEKTIKDLKELNVQIQKKVNVLENQCKDEEKVHWQKVTELQKHNQAAFTHFQALDERINFVATKVVHLGDQLEGVNTPRTRAAEAQMLLKYYKEFMDNETPESKVFNDPQQTQQAADIIQKLHLISIDLSELSGERFQTTRMRIDKKYSEIERSLLNEFEQAYFDGNKRKMKKLATILSNFKGYDQCMEIFITECQKGAYKNQDVYKDIVPLCTKASPIIDEVFSNPEHVMSKLVLHIYTGKLQSHIGTLLADKMEQEKYLRNLNDLYIKTTALSSQLSSFKMGNDASFLNKITKSIFQKYLNDYITMEQNFLRFRGKLILHRYYEAKNHQKRNITPGGMYELRRDLQNVIGAKANLNLGPTIQNYGGETFLSQEVAINILQEVKLALKRCQVLSNKNDLANNAACIFDILVQYLGEEHIDYALDLGLQAIPLADPKMEPELYFFDVVDQANTIFHLFEKLYSDQLLPLLSGTNKYNEVVQRKHEVIEAMENKLDMGLDRTLASMVGWIKHILKTEQKVSDFKPETDDMEMYSKACGSVVKYQNNQLAKIRIGIDGKNVEAVLSEFGVRFHRVVFEHLQQYQYNSMGAMLAICDVNEYRKCVKEFEVPLVIQLFDTLHSLCNLLVVVPDNLKQVCAGEQLVGLDKATLQTFVQLRADYKTARLANHFKVQSI